MQNLYGTLTNPDSLSILIGNLCFAVRAETTPKSRGTTIPLFP